MKSMACARTHPSCPPLIPPLVPAQTFLPARFGLTPPLPVDRDGGLELDGVDESHLVRYLQALLLPQPKTSSASIPDDVLRAINRVRRAGVPVSDHLDQLLKLTERLSKPHLYVPTSLPFTLPFIPSPPPSPSDLPSIDIGVSQIPPPPSRVTPLPLTFSVPTLQRLASS